MPGSNRLSGDLTLHAGSQVMSGITNRVPTCLATMAFAEEFDFELHPRPFQMDHKPFTSVIPVSRSALTVVFRCACADS